MARVTIEGLLSQCESRFELAMLIAYRAHAIASGMSSVVNNNNKFAVLALRELEAGKIDINALKETAIKKYALEMQTNIANNAFLSNDNSIIEENDSNAEDNSGEAVADKKGNNSSDLGVAKDFFSSDK